VPWTRANPRHAGPLTPPGNPTPALFCQPPALCGHLHLCTTLCDKASVNSVTLCHPPPYGRRATPLKEDGRTLEKGTDTCPMPTRDNTVTLPAEPVSPVISGPVRPSPPLCNHPRPCAAIPGAAGTQDDKTLPHPWLCTSRPSVSRTLESAYGRRLNEKFPHSRPRSRSWARTGHAMTPDESKIRQDSHQLLGVVRHPATHN
jgi:hypothetical protein